MRNFLLPLVLLAGCAFPAAVVPEPGRAVVIRTLRGDVGGFVLSSEGDVSVVKAEEPLWHGSCGTPVYLVDGRPIGEVVAGHADDWSILLVRRP